MPIDPRALMARVFPPVEQVWTSRESQLYALAIGLGADPLDEAALRYVYEGVSGDQLLALPTMANVLGYPGFWAREPDTGIDWRRLVHAEQQIALPAPLPASGRFVATNRVSALWDRGAGKGAWMEQQREVCDPSTKRLLATVTQLTLLRGDGGFAAGTDATYSDQAPPPPHPIPGRAPDHMCDLRTEPGTALLYRLSGDLNPLHADPAVARTAGFNRPILHGMATMGVAAHAVLRTLLGYEPSRFAAMRVRFTAPAFPGDTLRTELWIDPDGEGGKIVSLRTMAVERQAVVLNHGRVDLRPI